MCLFGPILAFMQNIMGRSRNWAEAGEEREQVRSSTIPVCSSVGKIIVLLMMMTATADSAATATTDGFASGLGCSLGSGLNSGSW